MKNDSGISLDADARAFAVEHHGEQLYNEHPFVYHLDQVVKVLRDFGHDEYGIVPAGYMHDLVEDTQVTLEQIAERYGSVIADYVDALTNKTVDVHGNALGNRRARQAYTHAHLRNIAAKHGDVVINLKLADRIANIEFSLVTDNVAKLGMYFSEHAHFEREVAIAGGDPRMWAHLDALVPACSRVLQRIKAERKAAKQPPEPTDQQVADAEKQLEQLMEQGEVELLLNMLNAEQVIMLAADWNDNGGLAPASPHAMDETND